MSDIDRLATESMATTAVEMLWRFFKTEQRWPSRKEFLLRALDARLDLETLRRSADLSLRAGSGDEARPAFAALARLPEVQELLTPLPLTLRQAASVFAAEALALPDNQSPKLHFRDVKKHWPDSSQAKLAFDVLRSTGASFFIGGGSGADPEDFYISLSIDTLRYEKVEDLNDVLRVPRYFSAREAANYPSGKHLELLRRIFEVSRSAQRWPRALEFAIEARTVGYVPQLVAELRPRFIRTEFRASQLSSLVLTLDALPWVDSSGETGALLVRTVSAIVDIWRTRSGSVELTLPDLGAALGVSTASLGPAVAFLESSRWCHLGHATDEHVGLVIVPGDPELVLRNLGVSSFDEYMNTWGAGETDDYAGLLPGRSPDPTPSGDDKQPPAVPQLSVEFLRSDVYKRVFEMDMEELRRTVGSGAWKASLILLGGILEGVLLDVLSRRENVTESVTGKKMAKASLVDLIEAGVELRLLQPSVAPFASVAKDYRDLTHPFRSCISTLRPSEKAVRAMLHALGIVIDDLDTAARDGRLAQFEAT